MLSAEYGGRCPRYSPWDMETFTRSRCWANAAIVIAFMGVLLVAIPTGIISAGFVEQYQNNANEESKIIDVDEIGELFIDDSSKFGGRTILQATEEYGVNIYMVLRDNMSILPTGDLKIQTGDILIVKSKFLEKRRGSSLS